jgi:intracellular multiplication protein IcmV
MKKNTHSRVKSMLASMFQIRTWSMYDNLMAFLKYLSKGAKKLFVISEPEGKLKFEKVMQKKHVSEKTLEVQRAALYRLSIILLFTAIVIFSYSIYCIINQGVRQFFMSLSLSAVALSFAFRYHYYYYQLKTKQLGCSIKQWWKKGVVHSK